jgi:hypothetical protein
MGVGEMERPVNYGVVPYAWLQTNTEKFLKPTENLVKED